jgi:hypothetical protein
MKGLWTPLLIALAWMALAALIGPHISGPPVACMAAHPACHTNAQMTWIAALFLGVPFLILNVLGTKRKSARR